MTLLLSLLVQGRDLEVTSQGTACRVFACSDILQPKNEDRFCVRTVGRHFPVQECPDPDTQLCNTSPWTTPADLQLPDDDKRCADRPEPAPIVNTEVPGDY